MSLGDVLLVSSPRHEMDGQVIHLLSVCLSVRLSLPVRPSVCLSVGCPSVSMSVRLSFQFFYLLP